MAKVYGCFKAGDPSIPVGASQVSGPYANSVCDDKCYTPTPSLTPSITPSLTPSGESTVTPGHTPGHTPEQSYTPGHTPVPFSPDPDTWYCLKRSSYLCCDICGTMGKQMQVRISNFTDSDSCCNDFKGEFAGDLAWSSSQSCATGYMREGRCPPGYGSGFAMAGQWAGGVWKVSIDYSSAMWAWSLTAGCNVSGWTAMTLSYNYDPYVNCPQLPTATVEMRLVNTVSCCTVTASSVTYECHKGDESWWSTHPTETCLDETADDGHVCKYELTGETYTDGYECATHCDGEVDVKGACCDTWMWYCQDNVYESECYGDFYEDTLCSELDPPCVAPVGRCCYNGQELTPMCQDDMEEEQCVYGYNGTWTKDANCPCPS